MKRKINVFMGSEPRPVGIIHYDAKGARENAAFQYDNAWLTASDGFQIDPNLPLMAGPHFHNKTKEGSVFHSVIADTEPDGWGRRVILRSHMKRRQALREKGRKIETRPLNALDFLLAVDDYSRVGALRFQDEAGMFQGSQSKDSRTAPPLIELEMLLAASQRVEANTESAADLTYLLGRGTSLGGLRPKCTVIDDNGHLSIGKFPSVTDERAVTKGEVLAMRLAKAAGINAADARLVESDGAPVALIKRFDRLKNGARIMYMSAATMLGAEATDPGAHSYTDIVDALRVNGADAQTDIEELWRRIAFSILITNVDDHLMNHGFLYAAKGKWRLAPAFDLNPLPERFRELKTWISEESGPDATIDALMSVTSYFRITIKRAKIVLAQVEKATANWHKEGRRLKMSDSELDQFADAFEHTERNAALLALAKTSSS